MSENHQKFDGFWRKTHSVCDKDRNEDNTTMVSYVPFILVFISGVSVAILLACWSPLSSHFFRPKLTERTFLPNAFSGSSSSDWPDRGHKRASSDGVDLRNEAVSAMHLAMEMQSKGKVEKANKLFQRAYTLDPSHADVAYEYGQHLERHQDDIIFAEHLYSKALVLNPDHSRAMTRQKNIQNLVRELDQKTLNRIDHKRDELYQIPDQHPGLRRIKHESYIQHIYHTVAIEGNSVSFAQARAIIETRMAVAGKSIMEHNELLGVDMALRYINSTLLSRYGNIRLDDILEIHKRVLGPVDPVEAGRLRKHQVFIAEHRPPPADELAMHMNEFISWMNAERTLSMHPIEYAALAHYKLVYVHPFFDGNGRTARLLMNLILMQSGFPPVTIKVDEKHIYYQHIVTANEGDVRPFIRFIAMCTERTLDQFLMCASSDTHDLVISDVQHDTSKWIIRDGA